MTSVFPPGRHSPMRRPALTSRTWLSRFMAIVAGGVLIHITTARAEQTVGPPQEKENSDAVARWIERTSSPSPTSENRAIKRNKTSIPRSAQRADGGVASLPYGKMLWPLAAVLGTIGLTAWLLRKWAAGGGRLGSTGAITVLARHYLSSKQSLCLVRLGRRVMLLGVTPESITAVADLGDSDEAAQLVAGMERSRSSSFTNTLAGFAKSGLSDLKGDDARETALSEASGRVQSLVERLKACGAGQSSAVGGR